MKIIARPRGTGKTRELLTQAYIDHAQVLNTNKRALQTKADAYMIPDVKIIDWNDLIYGDYDSRQPLYVHKLEDVMQEFFDNDFDRLQLAGFTVTLEDENGEI